MLSRAKYEVIIAHQIDVDTQPNRLVGVAIGQRDEQGEHMTRMTVKELVVHPELRRRHIASYLLGRLTQNTAPTEMVVATHRFNPEDWFIDGLQSAGFRHTSQDGSPSVWLPGVMWHGQGNLDSPDFVKGIEAHMPDAWNGYGEFYPTTDPQLRVYRDGALSGIVRPVEGTRNFDDDTRDFVISDAGDVQLDIVKVATQQEAMIALLNAYDRLA
jgi:hypothetical protein